MATILIVDDAAVLRSALKTFLKATAFDVAEAENGADALRWLASNPPPAAIVLDIDMPQMDGITALKMIRSKPQFNSVKVVMASTRATASVIKEAIQVGANEYVIKPCTKEILLEKLAKVGVPVMAKA